MLTSRRFFTTANLVHLYKAQILSFIELSTPGLYPAPSVLDCVDRVQRRFLREIGLTEILALRDWRLAPLGSRRDMSMLGALHKINLGTAPPQLMALFPPRGPVVEPLARQRLRHWRPLHTRQLCTQASFTSTELMQRSVFGLARVYNLLPQSVVDSASVKLFQRTLQRALLRFAEAGADDWMSLYSAAWKRLPRTQLDSLFG